MHAASVKGLPPPPLPTTIQAKKRHAHKHTCTQRLKDGEREGGSKYEMIRIKIRSWPAGSGVKGQTRTMISTSRSGPVRWAAADVTAPKSRHVKPKGWQERGLALCNGGRGGGMQRILQKF